MAIVKTVGNSGQISLGKEYKVDPIVKTTIWRK